MNSLGRERLVGDILKGFGHLHSIINLLHANETLCIGDICWCKLGWTTTRRLRGIRTVLRMKLRDGSNADTSNLMNRVPRFTRKYEIDNVFASSGGERAYCGG